MTKLNKIIQSFFDFIFPIECLGCGQDNHFICLDCLHKIETRVNLPFHSDNIADIYVMTDWNQKIIKEIVRRVKFRYGKRIFYDLQPYFEEYLPKINFFKNSVFVPVPLHKARKRKRGFNQAEILANIFSEVIDIPVMNDYLKRQKNTNPQARLKGEHRKANISNAFVVQKENILNISKDKPIYLIDDVASTLSTLDECALALRQEGFWNIRAIVFASWN